MTCFVTLPLSECEALIDRAVVDGSITGEQLDRYEVRQPGCGGCVVLVYEKHYYRAGNRLTLTVTLDDLTGKTRVHTVSGGGGAGLFRFDWGASERFEAVVDEALEQYRA